MVWALIGGVAGGFLVWVGQGHALEFYDNGMPYQDLAAVLLTAASLMVAIFGVIFAMVAIWGYTQFKRGVEAKTRGVVEEVIRAHLIEELTEGSSRAVLEKIVAQFLNSAREKPGTVEAWASALDGVKEGLKEVDDDEQA